MQFLDHVPSRTTQLRLCRYAVEIKSGFLDEDLQQKLHLMLDNFSNVNYKLLFSCGMGFIRHMQQIKWLVEEAFDSCELNYENRCRSPRSACNTTVTLRLNGEFTGKFNS